jgi:hypothetical protein
MITKCCFCDYQKERKLSKPILEVMADPELPAEDYNIWMERLVRENSTENYSSVKIHMGMKHKDKTCKGIAPALLFDEEEQKKVLSQILGATE